jgi:hypothetical protein
MGFIRINITLKMGDAMAIFKRFLGEGWREGTPLLKEFTYGLRKRREYTVGYWDKGEKKRELRALRGRCCGVGSQCTVLLAVLRQQDRLEAYRTRPKKIFPDPPFL